MGDLVKHPDGKARCFWPGTDPFYVAYHDTEWGVPEYDDRALFEKLILDGFQAGLSWITILRKRDNFRRAFADFQPGKIARFNSRKIEALMQDEGIVRNRQKIEGTVKSARAYLAIQERQGFSSFLWDIAGEQMQQNKFRARKEIPVESETSRKMSKALKEAGFGFCGPTIVYAFMQAVGMVNDHLVGCCRHKECAALGRAGSR
jgi:DNA-3-methyladenine glycosylase I